MVGKTVGDVKVSGLTTRSTTTVSVGNVTKAPNSMYPQRSVALHDNPHPRFQHVALHMEKTTGFDGLGHDRLGLLYEATA
jgi:hypothetical protein